MRVLVGCEFSGVVRDAFRNAGHDAWSCDLESMQPEGEWSNYHLYGDVRWFLNEAPAGGAWDLMIAHPPCQYLCSSGLHWNKRRPERAAETEKSLDLVRELMAAPIKRICIENSIGCISTRIRKPDQIIQPYQFATREGHDESKSTCLWLQNLPPLAHTKVLPLPARGYWANQTPSGQNKLGPSPERWKLRAKTYGGIADAMVEQWGGLE